MFCPSRLQYQSIHEKVLTFQKSCTPNDDLSEVGQKDPGLGSRECGVTSRQKIVPPTIFVAGRRGDKLVPRQKDLHPRWSDSLRGD